MHLFKNYVGPSEAQEKKLYDLTTDLLSLYRQPFHNSSTILRQKEHRDIVGHFWKPYDAMSVFLISCFAISGRFILPVAMLRSSSICHVSPYREPSDWTSRCYDRPEIVTSGTSSFTLCDLSTKGCRKIAKCFIYHLLFLWAPLSRLTEPWWCWHVGLSSVGEWHLSSYGPQITFLSSLRPYDNTLSRHRIKT